jgi:ribosomal protein S18 acetylase RimI-like enzyme
MPLLPSPQADFLHDLCQNSTNAPEFVFEPISGDNQAFLTAMLRLHFPDILKPDDPNSFIPFDPTVSYLARLRGDYIGEVTAYYDVDSDAEPPTEYGLMISSISVSESLRGCGVAARMLSYLMGKATLASYFFLYVRLSNTAAQRLYERSGFRTEKRIPGYYGDDDALVMRRRRDCAVPWHCL